MTGKKLYLTIEFLLLYLGLPSLLCTLAIKSHVLVPLLLAAILCLGLLLRDRTFDRKMLWNASALPRCIPRILLIFAISAAVVTLATATFDRSSFLGLVREYPAIWVIAMIFYPLFSVYPQELVYRAFLFHRYQAIFPSAGGRIVISALAFGFVHIVFRHPLPVVLTTAAGFLFAFTYARTRSLAAVWLEHALYGALIFTVGLGKFFYIGSLAAAAFLKEAVWN